MCGEIFERCNYSSKGNNKPKKDHNYYRTLAKNLEKKFDRFKETESNRPFNEGMVELNLMLIEATALSRNSLTMAILKDTIMDYKTYFMMVLHNTYPESLSI